MEGLIVAAMVLGALLVVVLRLVRMFKSKDGPSCCSNQGAACSSCPATQGGRLQGPLGLQKAPDQAPGSAAVLDSSSQTPK
jgi:hypothetical protein